MKPPKRECMDCRKLPPGQRPAVFRPLDERSGPRSPRCYTHMEAKLARERQRAREKRQEDIYGLTVDDHHELEIFQGGKCPCGNAIRHTDHNHRLARAHGHAKGQACKHCVNGLLCHTCNSDILGRGYNSTRLRALADYYDHPPARQLWGEEPSAS